MRNQTGSPTCLSFIVDGVDVGSDEWAYVDVNSSINDGITNIGLLTMSVIMQLLVKSLLCWRRSHDGVNNRSDCYDGSVGSDEFAV